MALRRYRPAVLATLLLAACASPAVPTDSAPPSVAPPATASSAPAATPPLTPASTPSPTLATATPATAPPTTAPPVTAVPATPPRDLACTAADRALVTPGQLTVGFSEPALPPWFGGDSAIAYPGEPAGTLWEVSDPYSAEGFESALAYAIAALVGVPRQSVQWVNVERATALAAGPKPFDLYLSQAPTLPSSLNVSYSRPYYEFNYAILGLFANPIAEVTTTDELRTFTLGAVEFSAASTLLSEIVKPTTPMSAFPSLDEARAALQLGDIDGLAIDLPTAFRLRDEEIPGAVVVGQFEATDRDLGVITDLPTGYAAILPMDSVYTGCVDGALEALDLDGTLDALRHTWLADRANAPVLE